MKGKIGIFTKHQNTNVELRREGSSVTPINAERPPAIACSGSFFCKSHGSLGVSSRLSHRSNLSDDRTNPTKILSTMARLKVWRERIRQKSTQEIGGI